MADTQLRMAIREFSDFENALAEQSSLYRELHPQVSVEIVPLDLNSLHAELFEKEGLRSGTWDIGFLVTDWLAGAIEDGVVEELTPRLHSNPVPDWPQGWARSIVEPLYFGDKLYSLPWHDGPECLIYRRDLFENAAEQAEFRNRYGYELKPPATWKQFADIAAFFTRPGKNLYGTMFAAFPDGHNTLYDFALQLWSRGGELEDERHNALLHTPQAIAALDFYRNTIRDASMCYPHAEKLDSIQSGDVFLSGAIAMMVNWFGFAARCDRPGSPLRDKVAIAPIPVDEGHPAVSLSVFWTFTIGSGSRHKDIAWDFIHFLTQPALDKGIVRHGAVGVRLSTWRDPEVQKNAPVYSKIEEISLGARKLPRSRDLPAFAAIVNDVVTAALTTDRASAEILREAQQRISAQQIIFR